MNYLKQFCFLAALSLLIFSNAFSQQPQSLKWLTSYTEATQLAESENKPVLLFFHGSDWCPPCIKMQKEVFANEQFIRFASDKILFLDVDFPKNKLPEIQLKHNTDLKKKFGLPEQYGQGYPQVIVIDATGSVLHQEKGYSGEGAQKFIDTLSSFSGTKK